MGYMRREILTKFESWIITEDDSKAFYKSTFTMEDGAEIQYSELSDWFANAKEVA